MTYIDVDIANPAKPRRAQRLTLLVDSGALYSVVPASILRKLGVKPHSRRSLILADGAKTTRRIGDLFFRLNGQQGASPVIFGEKGESVLRPRVCVPAHPGCEW